MTSPGRYLIYWFYCVDNEKEQNKFKYKIMISLNVQTFSLRIVTVMPTFLDFGQNPAFSSSVALTVCGR